MLRKTIDFFIGLIYIALFLVSFIDILGLYSFGFLNQETIPKILLVTFSAIGITLILDNRESVSKVHSPIKSLEANVKSISDTICNDDSFSYLASKSDDFLSFYNEILNVKPGAEIYVTSFEKTFGLKYDVGETSLIESFMQVWDSKIKDGIMTVKQLVHVCTYQDLDEVKDRLQKFNNCYNYCLNVIVGLPIQPFFDYVIIDNSAVIMSFSADVGSPNDSVFGGAIRSSDFATDMVKSFNILWSSGHSFVLKTKDGVNSKNLELLENLVTDDSIDASFRETNERMLKLIGCQRECPSIINLVDELHLLYNQTSFKVLAEIAKSRIVKTYNENHKLMTGFYSLIDKNIIQVMTTLIKSSSQEILAISIELEDETFWFEKSGEEVFSLNAKVISDRNIQIERIFIYNKQRSPKIQEIIQKQTTAGIQVDSFQVEQQKRGAYEDFIIVDKKTLLILDSLGGRISIDPYLVQKYILRFSEIKIQLK